MTAKKFQSREKTFSGTENTFGTSTVSDSFVFTPQPDQNSHVESQLLQHHRHDNSDTFSDQPFTFYPDYEDFDEGSFSNNTDISSDFNFQDQLVTLEDGTVVNLSDLDFTGYQYYSETGGENILLEDGFISTGRSVALAFFVLIFLIGLVGNVLVVYTVARYVTMRRVTYLYLLNLSMADILYLIVCLPTLSVSYTLVDWPFGRVFCKLENYIMSISMSVSVLTIMATGLDRFIAVMYPVRSRGFRTTKKAISVICLAWILSLIIMAPRIPIFDEIEIYDVNSLTTLCSRVASHKNLQLDTGLNFVFMYLLPLLVLSVCHFLIGRKLWTSARPGNRMIHTGQLGLLAMQDRRRIAKIVFAITTVFAIGWLPIHVYHLAEDFDHGKVLFAEVVDRGTIVLFFSFGANALNPIFYCLFSSSFRKHFKKVFRCHASRLATSIDIGDSASFRGPILQNGHQEYRQPPPILLPRPASILPESPSSAGRLPPGTVSLLQCPVTVSPSLPHMKPLLQRPADLQCSGIGSATDLRPDLSPLTTLR